MSRKSHGVKQRKNDNDEIGVDLNFLVSFSSHGWLSMPWLLVS